MKHSLARLWRGVLELRDFLREPGGGASLRELSRLHRFAHFCLLLVRSFSANRCPVRASALAYTSLLALIPVLVVAFSVASGLLQADGEQKIAWLINQAVDNLTPPAVLPANGATETSPPTTEDGATNAPAESVPPPAGDTRRQLAHTIHGMIHGANIGTLGVTGMCFLVVAALSLLTSIEDTFSDIWGVGRGRNWLTRIIQYWAVVTLLPLLLAVGLGFAGAPHVASAREWIASLPFVGAVFFYLLPLAVLAGVFALFYVVIPNTKVHWDAALVGGVVAALLWHLNNQAGGYFISRVITNSKLYGRLGMIPVLMLGLYFSWLILLLGAQVAYAYQNRTSYLQSRQCATVNQRGREFIALRLMTCLAERFLRGEPPAGIVEIARQLAVPTALLQQVMQVLVAARLVVEVAGSEAAFCPARDLATITCHDILGALRACTGRETLADEDPAHAEIYGEFQKILAAERLAAERVTVLAMARRATAPALPPGENIL